MSAKRLRWKARASGRRSTGTHLRGAWVGEIWEGRHARKFTMVAWAQYRGRDLFRNGRRYFATMSGAMREAERWLSRHAAPPLTADHGANQPKGQRP